MGEQEFLFVLIGVIVGLALCQILTGLAAIVVNRRSVRVYWVHLVWVGILFVQLAYYWHVQHTVLEVQREFSGYVAAMFFPTLLYVGVALLLPQVEPGRPFDYRSHYYENSRWFFAICAAGVFVLAVRNTSRLAEIATVGNFIRLAALAALCVLIRTRRRWVHAALAVTTAVLLVGFTAIDS